MEQRLDGKTIRILESNGSHAVVGCTYKVKSGGRHTTDMDLFRIQFQDLYPDCFWWFTDDQFEIVPDDSPQVQNR